MEVLHVEYQQITMRPFASSTRSRWRTLTSSTMSDLCGIDAIDATSPARTAAAPRHRRDVEFHTASDRNKRTSWKKRL